MLGLAAGDYRLDAALPEQPPVLGVVVAAVGDQAHWSAAWSTGCATYGRNAVEERDQLGDVVAVAACDREGEWDPARVDEEVVVGARDGLGRPRSGRLGAPLFGCTWLESAIARDHSSSPAAPKRASNSACSSAHTPARCHSSKRRQQVTPEPKPSSRGTCCRAIPVCSTNEIPAALADPAAACGPDSGSAAPSSAATAQLAPTNSSDTIQGAAAIGTPNLTTDADSVCGRETGPCLSDRSGQLRSSLWSSTTY